ncbi:MAG: DUF3298 and DUF4163 domain-containing protein [Cyclobacteriaceae bacterium]
MKYYSFAAMLIFAISCSIPTEKASDGFASVPESPARKMSFEVASTVALSKEDPDCKSGECASIEISYPELSELNRVNDFVEDKVREVVADFTRKNKRSDDISDLMTIFIKDFKAYKEAFPESIAPWYVNVEARVEFGNDQFYSVRIDQESYTGGAHTNTYRSYFLIDNSGRPMALTEIVVDKNALASIAEKKFRRLKKLGSDTKLSEAGYMFDNDQFDLSENVGFTSRGMIIFYNDYEIGSHADGPTEVFLSWGEIESI